MIQAFPPYATEKSLADGIRFRSTVGCLEDFNSATLRDTHESITMFAIAVSNQEAACPANRGHLAQLLSHPGIAGIACHSKVHDSPRSELDHQEDIAGSEKQVDHWQKVARPHVLGVIVEKDRPGLRRGSFGANRPHVFLNGGG